jgi:hypothetical protein
MKHTLLILALVAAAACEPIEPQTAKPKAPAVPNVCNANELQGLVGQNRKAIDKKAFKTKLVRILKPDSPVTLDYSEDRLNIVLDANGTIQRVMCA